MRLALTSCPMLRYRHQRSSTCIQMTRGAEACAKLAMDGTPVPVRFVDSRLRIPPTLTAFLPMMWYWADEELRAELQASIAAMVRRDPALLPALRARTYTFRAPAAEGLVPALELAGLLLREE